MPGKGEPCPLLLSTRLISRCFALIAMILGDTVDALSAEDTQFEAILAFGALVVDAVRMCIHWSCIATISKTFRMFGGSCMVSLAFARYNGCLAFARSCRRLACVPSSDGNQ